MAKSIDKALLVKQAEEWLSYDPNPMTKQHVQKLVTTIGAHDSNPAMAACGELASLFSKRIGFGTAGLRGRMQPGPGGMNDLVVIQTAQGLASYIKRTAKDGHALKAVVGYDHRSEPTFRLSSKQFGMYTKLVFQQAGIECILLDGFVATPLLAYSVSALQANVGIMITASHNPKADDGYKVYWDNGCQIIPPIDGNIANAIVEEGNLKPWIDYGEKLQQLISGVATSTGECFGLSDISVTKEMEDSYFATISSSGFVSDTTFSVNRLPKFVYTAMHGVGHPFAKRSFQTFNLPQFHSVPSQCTPDPEFPTVSFPNPEEKGALNEAMDYAMRIGCQIVLANDPDADRLGVAECTDGKWTVFTGDQIGVLLGVWLWETIGKQSDKVERYYVIFLILDIDLLTYFSSYISP